MRWYVWCLMLGAAVTVGCDQPTTETLPPDLSESTVPAAPSPGDSGSTQYQDTLDAVDAQLDAESAVPESDAAAEPAADAAAEPAADAAAEPAEEAAAEPSALKGSSAAVRFVANTRIEVPGMQCPYSCWPTVQETLAAQPGVEGVQLAEQPAGTPEGEIQERVVELKVNGKFDASQAIAALSKASFDGKVVK